MPTPRKRVKLRPSRKTILTFPSGERLVLRGEPHKGHVAVSIEGPEGMTIENLHESRVDLVEQKEAG